MSDRELTAGSPPPLGAVPGYAWSWLQRSRPVLVEAARRLTGQPPTPTFVDDLREACARDPFTQAVLADVVAEVAFSGRVPTARPPGVSWDRGLTWWAAALAGTTPAAFDAAVPGVAQRSLFDPEPPRYPRYRAAPAPRTRSAPATAAGPVAAGGTPPLSRERLALADALRALLREGDGEHVPASAVRRLVASLDPR
jgi:hypothetical protein